MMTDEQKSKVAELKAAITGSAQAPGGAPQAVRAAALVLKRELRREGITARVLAKALGVHETTLCRWQQDGGAGRMPAVSAKHGRGRGAGFRMVQVAGATSARIASASVPTPTLPTGRSLRVAHAPSGLVIDGLDVETLAALLRRMS